MKQQKKFWLSLLFSFWLVLCGSVSVGAAYTVTEDQLMQLETVFSQLDSKQQKQQEILDQQKNQLMKLQEQLMKSKEEISSSKKSVETLQTSLTRANESLQKSEEENKRAQKRLERQRNIWAVIAAVTVGAAIARG